MLAIGCSRDQAYELAWIVITTVGPRSILGEGECERVVRIYRTLACAPKWNKRNGPDSQQILPHQGCSHRIPVLLYAIGCMKIFIFVLPSYGKKPVLGGAFPSHYSVLTVCGIAKWR